MSRIALQQIEDWRTQVRTSACGSSVCAVPRRNGRMCGTALTTSVTRGRLAELDVLLSVGIRRRKKAAV